MADHETTLDAVDEAELEGTAQPRVTKSASSHQNSSKRNAFSELMSPKSKQHHKSDSKISAKPHAPATTFNRRDGLYEYIANPASFTRNVVIYHNNDFVVIKDLYPKATVHLLLLPRSPSKIHLHPFEAFDNSDPTFLSSVRSEASKLHDLAAKELQRLLGKYSSLDRPRNEAFDADPPPTTIPAGRDWKAEIMVGVHAHPSMNHLHVHVISKDRHSPCLKHRKHYNSFSTPFFVPLDDLPLAETDVRRHPGREGYLQKDFECWRCGKQFGNKFTKLKEHLEEEFEEWKGI